jgi:hypothetical protein
MQDKVKTNLLGKRAVVRQLSLEDQGLSDDSAGDDLMPPSKVQRVDPQSQAVPRAASQQVGVSTGNDSISAQQAPSQHFLQYA